MSTSQLKKLCSRLPAMLEMPYLRFACGSWLALALLSLVVANIDAVSKFIEITHIRFALVVFLASLLLAVLATYLAAIAKAGVAAHEAGEALGKEIFSANPQFDFHLYIAEYQRGLIPPIRWIAQASIKQAMQGDIVAGARMLARISQAQALLIAFQSLLALVALGGLAFGIKMQ